LVLVHGPALDEDLGVPQGDQAAVLGLVHDPALDEDLGVPEGDEAAVLGLVHDPALYEDLGVPQGDQVAVLGLLFIAGLTLNLSLEVESEGPFLWEEVLDGPESDCLGRDPDPVRHRILLVAERVHCDSIL